MFHAAARDAGITALTLTAYKSAFNTLTTEVDALILASPTTNCTYYIQWLVHYTHTLKIEVEQETAAKVAAAIDSEIDTLTSEIETFSADGSITALEKRSLVTLIAEIKAEYGTQTAVVGDANYGVYAAARGCWCR